jgi:hypothetical protein
MTGAAGADNDGGNIFQVHATSSLLNQLNRESRGFATTNAQGGNAALSPKVFQHRANARARSADGAAQSPLIDRTIRADCMPREAADAILDCSLSFVESHRLPRILLTLE